MTDDERGLFIFMAISLLAIVIFVIFGVMSTRRKNRTTKPSYHMKFAFLDDQPYLMSDSLDAYVAKRQWEIFQTSYMPGSVVEGVPTRPEAGADGGTQMESMRVSRVQRGLRAGRPAAKVGFYAYFEPFEFADLPRQFPIKSREYTMLVLDKVGVTVLSADGSAAWNSPWNNCKFAGHLDELKLSGPHGYLALRRDQIPEQELAEGLLEKYATYWQFLV